MRKEIFVIFLFLVIALAILVSASNIGLIESPQWQGNIEVDARAFVATVFGDLDGNGYGDLISIGCTDFTSTCTPSTDLDNTYIWINNGTTFTNSSAWQQNLTNSSGSLALGDIDNDGDLDLVISSIEESGGGTKIYINNGTTLIENSTWQNFLLGSGGANSFSVGLGDIDNDGDLDLIFPDMDSNRVIWINNGTSFENSSIWGREITDDVGKASIGLIDIDNDGDLDLNIAGDDSSRSYINNGTSFVYTPAWNAGVGDEMNVAWGDIDNDGDFDQVLGLGSGFRVLINNGTLFSIDSSWNTGMGSIQWGSIMLGDYDNNGYLDVVNTGVTVGGQIDIGDNNGTSFVWNFAIEEGLTGRMDAQEIWADVDNDGDLDLVNIADWKIYINNNTIPNTDPTPPESFSSSYKNREIALGWLNGSDNETPSLGLYYNLKLGTASNNHSIISGIYGGQGDASRGGTAFGYFGNMMQRKNFTLSVDRLSPSTTYYWSVQTIDTGLKAGNWSTVQSFTTSADLNRPNVTLNSPVDNANFSSYSVTFNVSVADENVTNVSLWGDWTGSFILNETNTSGIDEVDYIFIKDLTSYGDGVYTWRIEATDNETNVQNSSIRTFTIDTTPPSLSIVSPSNNGNSSDTGLDINYTVSDSGVGLDSCWYSNDTYTVNTSITCGTNITTLTWSEGSHNVTVWANDTLGNENSSSINFTIDVTNPVITVLNPANNTNTTDTGLDINYTVSDSGVGLDSCWYSNDTYSINTSITCGTNITTLTWSEGNHNVTVWANDTAGNEGKNITFFTIDTTPPSFDNPRNFTFNVNNSFSQNFSATDSVVEIGSYSLNDTSIFNISQTGLITNVTNLSTIAIYWLNISVNDTLGNLNSTVFFINITSDFDSPNVTLISPANSQSYTSNSQEITFSYNVSDVSDIINCSLIIDGSISLTNSSVNKLVTQSFIQTFTPASHTWSVNCTDALLNLGNSSSRSFTVTAPVTSSSSGEGSSGTTQNATTSFWTNTYVVSDEELKQEQGYTKELSKKQRIKISISNEIHYVGIVDISETTATINITSDPIQVILSIGEDIKLDLVNDSFYDLYVLLNSIENKKANLTIKSIHEEIPEGKGPIETSGDVVDGEDILEEEVEDEERDLRFWIFLIIGLIILGLYFLRKYLWVKEFKKRKKVLRRLNL